MRIPVFIVSFIVGCAPDSYEGPEPGAGTSAVSVEDGSTFSEQDVQALVDEQDRMDETVFRFEVQAQEHEQTFVNLWDRLRNGAPWEVLGKFHFEEILLGNLSSRNQTNPYSYFHRPCMEDYLQRRCT